MTAKEKRLLVLLLLAFPLFTIFIGWQAEFIMDTYPIRTTRVFFRIGCILVDVFLLMRLFHLILIRSDWSNLRKNLSMVTGGFLGIVLLLEIPFMFIPYSHGNGNTYSSRIWFERYWDENRLGYRDKEPDFEADGNKKRIFLLGDSFVAGHGINDPADRFSDILQQQLQSQCAIYNLGKCGADTKDELDSLLNFPLKPDFLVLSHIPNDIERAGKPTEKIEIKASGAPLLRFLSQGSFSLNYFYWKFNAWFNSGGSDGEMDKSNDFSGNPIGQYFEENIRDAHYVDIQKILDWCKENAVPLLVLTFPEMYDVGIDFTHAEIELPLEAFLKPQGVPVIHAGTVLREVPEAERIVNYNDAHPSVSSHKVVAELLLGEFKRLGWTD